LRWLRIADVIISAAFSGRKPASLRLLAYRKSIIHKVGRSMLRPYQVKKKRLFIKFYLARNMEPK